MPMQTQIGKTTLRLVTGDIADQDTDAVVTAAHWRLNKGTGTDGTIHTKGGPRIYEECRKIGGCPIGDAVITTGGDLTARHVIHAVGPVWRGGDEDEPALLASAYRRSLEVAAENKLRSISVPFIHPERRLNSGGALTAYEDELPQLYSAGVRAVVSLLNIPTDAAVYESAGFAFLCLPIPDGAAPTMEQALEFVRFVNAQRKI